MEWKASSESDSLLKTSRILIYFALAVLTQSACAAVRGFPDFMPQGTVVVGYCPTGQVMVKMAWTFDPDQPKDVNYRKARPDVVRCVSLAHAVPALPGDLVALGYDKQKRFRVLSRTTQK